MTKVTQAVTWFLAIIPAAVSLYVAYDLHSKGPIPDKNVELIELFKFNPLTDLAALGDREVMKITIGTEAIDNLVIAHAILRNAGQSPIVPADYFENIRVAVQTPYRILAVNSDPGPLQLSWNRRTEQQFEAQPALFNPGDSVGLRIYITNTAPGQADRSNVMPQVPLQWSARILNLRSFAPSPPRPLDTRAFSGITILIGGWRLPCMLALALFFFACYMYLLYTAGIVRKLTVLSGTFLAAASLISFMAAESITDLLFGGSLPTLPPLNSNNISVIAIHVVSISALLWKSGPRAARTHSTTSA
jgi:hypothetical protein